MPRPAKGARLYLHPAEQIWLIRDGPITRRTGCGALDRAGAESALGQYLSEKFRPAVREGDPARLAIAEVLTAYGREHAPHTKAPATIGYAIAALVAWWRDRSLSDVRGATCRAYTEHRCRTVRSGTARRELGVLQAAIRHWHREHGPLDSIPEVTLAAKGAPRERWLTRSEAALLLAGALGWYRETWSDIATRRVRTRWRRYAGGINRHLARFILLGLYTGTRRGALLDIQWMANVTGGWIDIDRGVMHRKAPQQSESKKRQPPVRLGRRILAHLRRWQRLDEAERQRASAIAGEPVAILRHVVTWKGLPVDSVRTAWDAAIELSGLGGDVTAHTLRHTRATWLMQSGIDIWEASGSLGMSAKTLQDVYGHHHPDFQKAAAEV